MIRVALDTNCFIDATDPSSHAFAAMCVILAAARGGRLVLFVSLHTLAELKSTPARQLAKRATRLPHYPVGTLGEQVARIGEAEGTFGDAKRNQVIQEHVKMLARAGTSLRDRCAYLDAMIHGVDFFVTSDRALAGDGPARRIADKYGLRIVTPQQLADWLDAGATTGPDSTNGA